MCHYFNPMLPILTPHKYIVGVCKLPCIALFYFYELLYTSFQFYSSTICVCNVKTINDYYLFIYLFIFTLYYEFFSVYSSRPPELKSVEFFEISLSVFDIHQTYQTIRFISGMTRMHSIFLTTLRQ